MAGRLDKRIAMIFGAGCVGDGWGNGNATAVLYAREGAAIVSIDLNQESAQRTADLVRKEGGRAIAIAADGANLAHVTAAVERTMKEFGRIDILHNNIGINEAGGPVEASEESWDRVMRANLKSMFLACKCVLPIMEQQGGGVIVNISSSAAAGWTGSAHISYSASKAAVNNLTRVIAVEYAARNIRCNAIMPGLMDTPRIYRHKTKFKDDFESMRNARSRSVPMKKMGTAWDVAHAALYLASDEAEYVTGAIIPVDGGLTCAMGVG